MFEKKNYFKDMYDDFFGVESLKGVTLEKEEENDSSQIGSQEEMTSLFERINKLYISDESKNLLKKIIEYMRKYQEKIETNYVPFRIIITSNSDKITDEVNEILYEAAKYFNYLETNKRKDYSLFKVEEDIDYSEYGYTAITNVEGLNLEEDKIKKQFFNYLDEYFKEDPESIITISSDADKLTNLFLGNEEFKNRYFDFNIEVTSPDVQDLYNAVLEKIETDDKMKVDLLDYMTKTYDTSKDFIEYQNDLIKYISFNKELPKLEEEKSIDDIFAELNELVGLDKVKKVLYELVDLIKLKESAGDDLKIKNMNLHMVFLGNPGTGKTTIARMISSILYNLKYIKEDKLVEVSSKDLVAEYVGQTAPKTMSVIEKSMNGVLFIDEAYSLAVKDGNSYNAEAIATLIQAMENYRDKLVVIFAGYTKEMQDFLNSNSGITSRIGYTFEFDDYTTEELEKIFVGMMNKSGFEVEEEALAYLRQIIDENRNMKNFGNARFVRNIFEKSIVKHASRVKDNKSKKVLKTITKEDINTENLIMK